MKIFCDLDGTLVNVAPRHYRVYRESIDLLGGVPLEKNEYWGLKRRKIKWPEILRKSNISQDIESEFLKIFISKIEALDYLEIDELFPNTLKTLRVLSDFGHDLYLVSLRRNASHLHHEIQTLGLEAFFKEILSGHSETDGYDKKIELITNVLDDKKGVIIGDTEADVITGKMLDLTTIAVTSGIRDAVFLEELKPDYLLKGIGEVQFVESLQG